MTIIIKFKISNPIKFSRVNHGGVAKGNARNARSEIEKWLLKNDVISEDYFLARTFQKIFKNSIF